MAVRRVSLSVGVNKAGGFLKVSNGCADRSHKHASVRDGSDGRVSEPALRAQSATVFTEDIGQ